MKFRKEDPKTFEVRPEGDYLLEAIKAEPLISNGAKTRGCGQVELQLRFEKIGGTMFETLTFPDENTDPDTAEFLANKINTFLASTSYPIKEGDDISHGELAENCIGLRGWARVTIDKFTKTQGANAGQETKKNKIHFWYTDKPKFPRAQPAQPVTAPVAAGEDPFENA